MPKREPTYDERRHKPRVNLTMDADLRAAAEELAKQRRLSLSQLFEQLIMEELKRERRREALAKPAKVAVRILGARKDR